MFYRYVFYTLILSLWGAAGRMSDERPALGKKNMANALAMRKKTTREVPQRTFSTPDSASLVESRKAREAGLASIARTKAGPASLAKTNTAQTVEWTQMGGDFPHTSNDGASSATAISMNAAGDRVAQGGYTGYEKGFVRVLHFAGGTWEQLGDDIQGDANGDYFGESVSLNAAGDILTVGAPKAGSDGQMKVYRWSGSAWTPHGQTLNGEAIRRRAGELGAYSVTSNAAGSRISGYHVFNDPWEADGKASGFRVYDFDGATATWTQVGQDISEPWLAIGGSGEFGHASRLNAAGDIIVVTAPYATTSVGELSGYVRVYALEQGTWTQVGQEIPGAAAGDRCCRSLSINAAGNIIALATRDNAVGGYRAGHARVYKNVEGTWTQLGEDIVGEAAGDQMGYPNTAALNAAGDIIALGSTGHGDGLVRIYHYDGAAWNPQGDIDGRPQAPNQEGFGGKVCINAAGDRVAASATAYGSSTLASTGYYGEVRSYSATGLSVLSEAEVNALLSASGDASGGGGSGGAVEDPHLKRLDGTWVSIDVSGAYTLEHIQTASCGSLTVQALMRDLRNPRKLHPELFITEIAISGSMVNEALRIRADGSYVLEALAASEKKAHDLPRRETEQLSPRVTLVTSGQGFTVWSPVAMMGVQLSEDKSHLNYVTKVLNGGSCGPRVATGLLHSTGEDPEAHVHGAYRIPREDAILAGELEKTEERRLALLDNA